MARNKLTPVELEMRKSVSSKLQLLINERGINQAELSQMLNIPKSTLNGYFNGTSLPSAGNVQKIADFFNIKKSEIDPRFKSEPKNIVRIKETKVIPVIGQIACGIPLLTDENIIDTVAISSELVPSGNSFFLRATGDSMSPIIQENSLVLIREQHDVENGEIAAILFDDSDEATLKKVRKLGDSLLLESINEDYDPILVTKDNPARIIGKALKVLNDI